MAADLLHDVLGLGLDGLEGADDLLAKVGLKAESFRTERQGSPSPWERSQSPIKGDSPSSSRQKRRLSSRGSERSRGSGGSGGSGRSGGSFRGAKPRRDGAASAAEEKKKRSTLDYQRDGDMTMYRSDALALRRKNRSHPEVIRWLDRYFDTFATTDETISRSQLFDFNIILCKALFDPDDFEVESCREVVADDMDKDVGDAETVSRVKFRDTLFETVDIWTESAEIEEYISFLSKLYDRIVEDGAYRPLDRIASVHAAEPHRAGRKTNIVTTSTCMHADGFDVLVHCLKRTRREKTTGPKIGRIDFDVTELEKFLPDGAFHWHRHRGVATLGDAMDVIKQAQRDYVDDDSTQSGAPRRRMSISDMHRRASQTLNVQGVPTRRRTSLALLELVVIPTPPPKSSSKRSAAAPARRSILDRSRESARKRAPPRKRRGPPPPVLADALDALWLAFHGIDAKVLGPDWRSALGGAFEPPAIATRAYAAFELRCFRCLFDDELFDAASNADLPWFVDMAPRWVAAARAAPDDAPPSLVDVALDDASTVTPPAVALAMVDLAAGAPAAAAAAAPEGAAAGARPVAAPGPSLGQLLRYRPSNAKTTARGRPLPPRLRATRPRRRRRPSSRSRRRPEGDAVQAHLQRVLPAPLDHGRGRALGPRAAADRARRAGAAARRRPWAFPRGRRRRRRTRRARPRASTPAPRPVTSSPPCSLP